MDLLSDVTNGVEPIDMTKQWIDAYRRFQQQPQPYAPPLPVSPLDFFKKQLSSKNLEGSQ
jgi:hypothetical protein